MNEPIRVPSSPNPAGFHSCSEGEGRLFCCCARRWNRSCDGEGNTGVMDSRGKLIPISKSPWDEGQEVPPQALSSKGKVPLTALR